MENLSLNKKKLMPFFLKSIRAQAMN